MTIKGIAAFLKKRLPNHRRKVPVSFFAGRRIAIDTALYAYAYMATAIGGEAKKMVHSVDMKLDEEKITTQWLGRFVSTVTLLKDAGLRPVFVFDGAEVPVEKTATRAKRSKGRADVRGEIQRLKANLNDDDLELNVAGREQIAKLMARDIRITPPQHERLRKLLRACGVVVMDAPGEGEAYCAYLVRSGYCTALYTSDSDAGAYRAPIVITEIEQASFDSDNNRYQQCEVIYYQQIFSALELTPEQYIDLCILSGTDYNDNIAGKGVGKCYPLLKQYGSIEAIPDEKLRKAPSAAFLVDVDRLSIQLRAAVFAPVEPDAEVEEDDDEPGGQKVTEPVVTDYDRYVTRLAALIAFKADVTANEAYVRELLVYLHLLPPKEILNYQRVREIFQTPFTVKKADLCESVVDYHELTRLLKGYGVLFKATRLLMLLHAADGTTGTNAYVAQSQPSDWDTADLL